MNIEVHNLKTEGDVHFNQRNPVPAGRVRNYALAGFTLSPGFSWKFMASPREAETRDIGGLMVGVDAGCMVFFPLDDWRFKEEVVVGPPVPNAILNPYIRLTLGGGGFEF